MTPRINQTSVVPPTPKFPKGFIHHDAGLRMQALAMVEAGIPVQKASEITGMTVSTIYRIRTRAIERGYDKDKCRQLFLRYVVDSETKGGRPRKDRASTTTAVSTTATTNVVDPALEAMQHSRESAASGEMLSGSATFAAQVAERQAIQQAQQANQQAQQAGREVQHGGGQEGAYSTPQQTPQAFMGQVPQQAVNGI